jgi:signal transduction histidine kinase
MLGTMYDDNASAFRLVSWIVEHALEPVVVIDPEGRLLLANRAARELPGIDVRRSFERSEGASPEVAAFLVRLAATGRAFAELALSDGRGGARRIALDGRAHDGRYVVRLREAKAPRFESEARLRPDAARGLGAAVHDMNNLLAIIATTAGQLVRERDFDARTVLAKDVRAAAERAVQLARRVTALSQSAPEGPRTFDVAAAIRDVRPLLERALGDGIELRLVLDGELPEVCADREELGHVLVNLATNARDAMPHGGRVTIEASSVAAEGRRTGGHVLLTFSDDGEGMPGAVRERAFDPFFTTKGSRGTGLGLANAREFVRRSGGRITIRSAPGRGTTIVMALPPAGAREDEALEA